jgi:anti-sigma B factor antagonist
MNYEVTEENGVAIIKVNLKRATVDVVKDFKNFLFNLIDNEQKKKIILDLSNVEFVDSSFLGAVVSGLKKVTAIKGDIKVVELQAPVRAMFELTRLYKVFEIFDNKQDAINSF